MPDALKLMQAAFEDDEYRQAYGAERFKVDIAFALHKARSAREISQAELAKRIGVSQAYIAKLESGEANPTIGKVGAILSVLWFRVTPELVELDGAGPEA